VAGQTIALDRLTAHLISLELWPTMIVLRLAYPDPTGHLPRDRIFDARAHDGRCPGEPVSATVSVVLATATPAASYCVASTRDPGG
jgi:hypothetical protein